MMETIPEYDNRLGCQKDCITYVNALTDLLFLSCPAIENQWAPHEFAFISPSVNPVP
jgi:hypothetical protein